MTNYETEEEQLAALKDWWKQNGTAILVGISIGLAILFGWKAWQNHQKRITAEASIQYTLVLEALQDNNFPQVVSTANLVIDNYAKSPYAALSSLAKAKAQVALEELDNATTSAEQAVSLAKTDDIKSVSQLRLAQLHLNKGSYDAGLDVLGAIKTAQFVPQADVIKGDIYLAKGDKDAAISAYKNALDAKGAELTERLRVIARLKYENLAGKYEPSS